MLLRVSSPHSSAISDRDQNRQAWFDFHFTSSSLNGEGVRTMCEKRTEFPTISMPSQNQFFRAVFCCTRCFSYWLSTFFCRKKTSKLNFSIWKLNWKCLKSSAQDSEHWWNPTSRQEKWGLAKIDWIICTFPIKRKVLRTS